MTSRMNFILGLVMLIVAATAAVTIGTRDVSSPSASHAAEDVKSLSPNSFAAHGAEITRNVSEPARRTAVLDEMLTIQIDPRHPESDRLEPLARQVEIHARQRLARMTKELDLSVDQQRRIFPKLVQTSQSYHPAMIVAGAVGPGSSGGFGAGEIETELDPGQAGLLVESSVNDLMLWREIIAQLESRLHMQTPEPAGGGAPQPASDTTGGGRNLFDMVPAGR